jgi:hypothetical protein
VALSMQESGISNVVEGSATVKFCKQTEVDSIPMIPAVFNMEY